MFLSTVLSKSIALRTPNNIILSWLGCDLSFPANKLVSGEHCKIVQYENSGMVWLEDMRYVA